MLIPIFIGLTITKCISVLNDVVQLNDFMKNKKILLGTSKGLVVFGKQENGWNIEKVHFLGLPVRKLS